jgi:predicted CDP-diglyceride synthetase/phosphatidate cytidylyltransferase
VMGAIHGTMLGLLGLIGDLTASMLKRNAGLKDFGDLLPEHGGFWIGSIVLFGQHHILGWCVLISYPY